MHCCSMLGSSPRKILTFATEGVSFFFREFSSMSSITSTKETGGTALSGATTRRANWLKLNLSSEVLISSQIATVLQINKRFRIKIFKPDFCNNLDQVSISALQYSSQTRLHALFFEVRIS